jgi:L-seryl-tRNA(Ser) seleniumtransferase
MQFRDLPAVDELAGRLAAVPELADVPVPLIAGVAREAIDRSRRSIAAGENPDPMARALASLIELARRRPRRVINATGVLLHTNLGRAPLHPAAVAAASHTSAGYTNLEFDLGSGNRGGRGSYVETLLQTLTGAESALVVNNNAGALFLALAALAGGNEAVVSRGELIEIGGSFRLPDLMSASGARLVEVGTTNRTRASDYAAAMATAALVLKVHPSNYRIEGFAEEVGYRELGEVCAAAGIPFVADLGSGLLDTRVPWLEGAPPRWLDGEPGVRQTLEAGAAVVLFSGDKLLGGPQAGIAVGRRELIERMRKHPIARALRLDGATMASLAATLELYASGQGRSVPFWHMATIRAESLQSRVEAVLSASGVAGAVVDGESLPGAGSVPGATIPTPTLELRVAADASWKTLIAADPPIVARRRADTLMLDLRTVAAEDDETVASVLATVAGHP